MFLFQTQVMWEMESPNACTMNATLNGSLTGFNIIPIIIMVIVICIVAGISATFRGYS